MSEPLIGVIPKGNKEQFEKLNKKIHITQDASEITDLQAVPETNFLFGGLNLIYGKDGSGKSWQTSSAIKNSDANNFYLDTDGSNGKLFVKHCINNNVHYISADTIDTVSLSTITLNLFIKIQEIIKLISTTMTKRKNVIVIDSLTSIAEGLSINNAEDISPPLYDLNKLAAKYDLAILLIDHATENKELENGFKLEGNAGAKRRTTVTVNRYLPIDPKKVSQGGTFICERARGNSAGLIINSKHIVTSANINDALKFILKKCPKIKTKGISKSDATTITRHDKDQWVREYFDLLFDSTKKGRTTILTLKEKYLNN